MIAAAAGDERMLLECGTAAAYAASLLDSLGVQTKRPILTAGEHPVLTWAGSGLMHMTGCLNGEAQMCPVAVASCADGVLAALNSIAPSADMLTEFHGASLLVERAALAGLLRHGAVSPGGGCRLIEASDGTLAVNLPRPEDWLLVPAWLETPAENWPAVITVVARHPIIWLVERARWLGLAVSHSELPTTPRPWFDVIAEGPPRVIGDTYRPRVIDLSSLWAGPLCGRLLHHLGAEVVKVESSARPDGARFGPAAVFDALNAGKASIALDFRSASDRILLGALIDRADIVIEASRPRALRQLGIDAEARVRGGSGQTWISLTGYGRREPEEHWIAYGDDAGVAGGLSELLRLTTGESLFCADAIADPLTGLHAALAAWASHRKGGGRLLSIAMRDVVANVVAFDRQDSPAALTARFARWRHLALGHVVAPRAIRPARSARPLGADTANVLREWVFAG